MNAWWMVVACSLGPTEAPKPAVSVKPDPVPVTAPNPSACATPAALPDPPPSWRWVSEADFHPKITQMESEVRALRGEGTTTPRMTCTFGEADFDGNGSMDLAALISHSATGASRLIVYLSGEAAPRVLSDLAALEGGGVYTSLGIKPAGEDGILARDSSTLSLRRDGPRASRMRSLPGVTLCRSIHRDASGRPTQLTTDNLCYCTEQFFFVENEGFQSAEVCD